MTWLRLCDWEEQGGPAYLHLGERAGNIGLGVHGALPRLRTALLCQALQEHEGLSSQTIAYGQLGTGKVISL